MMLGVSLKGFSEHGYIIYIYIYMIMKYIKGTYAT